MKLFQSFTVRNTANSENTMKLSQVKLISVSLTRKKTLDDSLQKTGSMEYLQVLSEVCPKHSSGLKTKSPGNPQDTD